MREPSRVLAGVVAMLLVPLPGLAAPPEDEASEPAVPPGVEGPALDTDEGELPLDTEDGSLPLDTDSDAEDGPPLAIDEAVEAEVDTATELDGDDDYQYLRDSPEARTARRWLRAGIAATSVGVVLVGGGLAMGLADPCDPDAGNNCFTDARNRAALTMGVPGGVLLVGGVTMTIVGALQRRRLFFERANAGLAMSRDHIGVVVVGRF